MISSEIADKIIAAAQAEKSKMDAIGREYRESYNQPLGYHVFTVSAAVAPDIDVPFAVWVERSNDQRAIRTWLQSV